MSLLKSIADKLPDTKAVSNLPVLYNAGVPAPYLQPVRTVGNEITFYNTDNSQTFIDKGYNLNDAIFSIVSKNAEKCSQVRLYHIRVKKNERKTLREYNTLLKGNTFSREVVKELNRMKKSMVEDYVPDSKLARLLDKPNRFQTQAEWIEQLVGFRELTGEANLWLNRGLTDGPPLEMLIIPKANLNIVGDPGNPWEILSYVFTLNGNTVKWAKEDVIQWKYPNYNFSSNLEHLRGLAPLESGKVLMQAMNEGDERVAISNKNAGAAGLAFLKNLPKPTLDQAADIRWQFNSAVNNAEMASKIAVLGGEWGYINFGYSLDQLKVLDQYDLSFDRLCRVFKTPPGIFKAAGTWDNQKQFERKWIFSKVAVMLNQLRGILDEKLVMEFDLDPEVDAISFDIMSLDELSEDIKDQVAAVQNAYWLTVDEKRSATGYEPLGTPEAQKVLAPQGLTPLDELAGPVGGSLDAQMQDLQP